MNTCFKGGLSMFDVKRRQFFKGSWENKDTPLRPPWSLVENLFQGACTQCGDCLTTCPEHILLRESPNGYPIVDFKLGECTFCKKCVDVCPTTALDKLQALPWSAKGNIQGTCLTKQAVICTTCAEQCELDAIRFKPQIGKVAQPDIDVDVCTGCGACVATCPSQAIGVY